MLVNTTGSINGFEAIDMLVEHAVNDIKVRVLVLFIHSLHSYNSIILRQSVLLRAGTTFQRSRRPLLFRDLPRTLSIYSLVQLLEVRGTELRKQKKTSNFFMIHIESEGYTNAGQVELRTSKTISLTTGMLWVVIRCKRRVIFGRRNVSSSGRQTKIEMTYWTLGGSFETNL